MKQLNLAKKILHADEVDLRNSVRKSIIPGQYRYCPPEGKDGMCYNITTADALEYYKQEENTVVSMWNVRGGRPHGHCYFSNNLNIFRNALRHEKNNVDLYGEETYKNILNPSFYNKVAVVNNGLLKKEYHLTLDINNPENIIVWKELSYVLESIKKSNRNKYCVVLDGKFYELDGDQSIKNCGSYKRGLKNKTWLSKQSREEGRNMLTELIFKVDGGVISSLLRGANLSNETNSNKYFRVDDGELHTAFKKKVVGKLHNGVLN